MAYGSKERARTYSGYAAINRAATHAAWSLMSYSEALAMQGRLMDALDVASDRIRSMPGVGSGPMGLTPDSAKTPAWRAASMDYRNASDELRRFNAWFTKQWRAEYRATLESRRASRIRRTG